MDCLGGGRRVCANCGYLKSSACYSDKEWCKGERSSCKECVDPNYQYEIQCSECDRVFKSRNNLEMHMQVHRPRNIACPICGDRRFKSGANAVQHVESGGCSQCGGGESARKQISQFACKKQAMRRFLTEVPMITYYGDNPYGEVPDYPYKCPDCSIHYRNLSQLMQHQDQKHGDRHLVLTNL